MNPVLDLGVEVAPVIGARIFPGSKSDELINFPFVFRQRLSAADETKKLFVRPEVGT